MLLPLREWISRVREQYRERARRAEWERLTKKGQFKRGRTETEEGVSFSGELSTKVIRKDQA